jgi:hypothetical protein
MKELKQAKAVVNEPTQPKIKLKVAQGTDTPNSSKKITIHVGRGGTDSPAPPTAQSSGDGHGANGVKSGIGASTLGAGDKDRSVSATPSSTVPPPAAKAENGAQASPTNVSRPGNTTTSQFVPAPGLAHIPTVHAQPVPPPNLLEPKKLRAEGKGKISMIGAAKT